MNRYESHYVLLIPSHTIETRLHIMIIGIGCYKNHQLIELKHLVPKYLMEQDRTRP